MGGGRKSGVQDGKIWISTPSDNGNCLVGLLSPIDIFIKAVFVFIFARISRTLDKAQTQEQAGFCKS